MPYQLYCALNINAQFPITELRASQEQVYQELDQAFRSRAFRDRASVVNQNSFNTYLSLTTGILPR